MPGTKEIILVNEAKELLRRTNLVLAQLGVGVSLPINTEETPLNVTAFGNNVYSYQMIPWLHNTEVASSGGSFVDDIGSTVTKAGDIVFLCGAGGSNNVSGAVTWRLRDKTNSVNFVSGRTNITANNFTFNQFTPPLKFTPNGAVTFAFQVDSAATDRLTGLAYGWIFRPSLQVRDSPAPAL